MDSTDFALKGKASMSRKDPYWSFKLNSPVIVTKECSMGKEDASVFGAVTHPKCMIPSGSKSRLKSSKDFFLEVQLSPTVITEKGQETSKKSSLSHPSQTTRSSPHKGKRKTEQKNKKSKSSSRRSFRCSRKQVSCSPKTMDGGALQNLTI